MNNATIFILRLSLLVVFSHTCLMSYSQTKVQFKCGYDDLWNQVKNDREMGEYIDTILQSIRKQALVSRGSERAKQQSNDYVIPVVVHLVGSNASGITDAQVQNQIQLLNQAFANGLGATSGVADDAQIEFCLAQKKPLGAPFSGIERYSGAYYNNIANNHHLGTTGANGQTALGALAHDPSRYLNIWVVNKISLSATPYSNVVLGYSPFPLSYFTGQAYYLDGVVMRLDAFGNGSSAPNYNLGRTLVHEVGHYLGLFHTFQNACYEVTNGLSCNAANAGDECCDTPPVAVPNQNNCVANNSCPESPNLPDQIENHMDYAYDACRTTFTEEQADRMHSVIQLYRSNLVSYSNLINTGVLCLPPGPNPTFVTFPIGTSTQLCVGSPIGFQPGYLSAASYSWIFPTGSPATSTVQQPTGITFNTPGIKNISLTVTDGLGGSLSYSMPIYVIDCIPYTGDQAHWYFGNHGEFDFSNGYAQEGVNGALISNETCASISDNSGNLLFYTNGRTVWNKNHAVMANGLNGSPNSSPVSSSQGALIVPRPGTPNRYYIFTTSDVDNGAPIRNGLTYYEVDMTLSGGLGQVITPPQGIQPAENYVTTEHLAGIPHCNGQDYWIIVKPMSNNYAGLNNPGPINNSEDYILAYQLTSSGLIGTPVASNFGSVPYSNIPSGNNWIGQIDVSRDKELLAISEMGTSSIVLFSFDCQSGEMKDVKTLGGVDGYSVCFSPNKKVLYASYQSKIKQFDLSNLSDCNQAVPDKTLSLPSNNIYATLQLGPDDRIYVSRHYGPLGVGSNPAILPVINFSNNPNTTNISNECGLNLSGAFLTGTTRWTRSGLPNMIDAVTTPPPTDFSYCFADCGEVRFENLGCGTIFNWDFGDGNTLSGGSGNVPALTHGGATSGTYQDPIHTYSVPGSYTVSFSINGGTPVIHTVSTASIVVPPPPIIIGPNPICIGSTGPFTYHCITGLNCAWTATNASPTTGVGSSFTVSWTSLPANLSLTVTDPSTGCSNSTTITITETAIAPIANAGADVSLCAPNTTVLNGTGNGSMIWTPSTGLSCNTCPNPIANPITSTTYTLTVSNGCGTSTDQVVVAIRKAGFDLVIKDAPDDIGVEPNTVSANVWQADFGNCSSSSSCTTMENPEYKVFGDNWFRVRVENMGCAMSPDADLHLYWTIGRAFEYWEDHWFSSSVYPSNVVCSASAGDEITASGPVNIPPIPAGGNIILTKSWRPPNPAPFGCMGPNPMICLLGRIVSIGDPMFNEQSAPTPIYDNVFNNNNVATLNTTLVDVIPNNFNPLVYSFLVNNPIKKRANYSFTLSGFDGKASPFFREGGSFEIAFESLETEKENLLPKPFVIRNEEEMLRLPNIVLEPGTLLKASVRIKHPGYKDRKKESRFSLVLRNNLSANEEIIGTQFIFEIKVKKKKRRCWLLFWKR